MQSQINKCPNQDDYSPCACDIVAAEYTLSCSQKQQKEIRDAFRRTSPADFPKLTLSPASNESTIVADLLGSNHRVTRELWLSCPSTSYPLSLDPDAFMSSRKTIKFIYINNCNLSGLDFHFLVGFEVLEMISFSVTSNIGQALWSSMPPIMPKLATLSILYSTGLNDWTEFPPLTPGLQQIQVFNSELTDQGMDRIAQWAQEYSSDTLVELYAAIGNLTKIPKQISSLSQLKRLYLFDQLMEPGIATIPAGSLTFTAPVQYLNLFSCGVKTIEPGAFKGRPMYSR